MWENMCPSVSNGYFGEMGWGKKRLQLFVSYNTSLFDFLNLKNVFKCFEKIKILVSSLLFRQTNPNLVKLNVLL